MEEVKQLAELNKNDNACKYIFHRIRHVKPAENYVLLIVFMDGTKKYYDVASLFERIDAFGILKNVPELFERVQVDSGGYGISWNDVLDLSCDELWNNGRLLLEV